MKFSIRQAIERDVESICSFDRIGIIHNLDEDDPELVYCKMLRETAV